MAQCGPFNYWGQNGIQQIVRGSGVEACTHVRLPHCALPDQIMCFRVIVAESLHQLTQKLELRRLQGLASLAQADKEAADTFQR